MYEKEKAALEKEITAKKKEIERQMLLIADEKIEKEGGRGTDHRLKW
jgi:hypothetical protein